jgi:hypothetical protein
VLSCLYLGAVLPCLADLADQDPAVREILGETRGSIVFRVIGGPAATLKLGRGRIEWSEGAAGWPSVQLLFFSDRHLNAFFAGRKWAVPLPLWGGWRIGLLARFARIAALLESVLDGAPSAIATAAGRRLHARLSLIAAGLGLPALARGDEPARRALRAAPEGLACFSIGGEQRSTVWFDHGSADCAAGWGDPPRRPEVSIAFADIDVAYAAMRDEVDTLAAVGGGQIRVAGLVPLADALNVVMERLRVYLKPHAS